MDKVTTIYMNAVLVWNVEAALGEWPMWSVAGQALWFVDIKQGLLHRLGGDGDRKTSPSAASPASCCPHTLADWLSAAAANFLLWLMER